MEVVTAGQGGFHSISFPSEWGLYYKLVISIRSKVSIQLVSPASGDRLTVKDKNVRSVFPFN